MLSCSGSQTSLRGRIDRSDSVIRLGHGFMTFEVWKYLGCLAGKAAHFLSTQDSSSVYLCVLAVSVVRYLTLHCIVETKVPYLTVRSKNSLFRV